MSFYEIEFPLAGLSADRVEEVLLEAGASSITFLDRGDDPVLEPKPGEFRLWSNTLVRALFDESHDAARNIDLLATGLGWPRLDISPLPENLILPQFLPNNPFAKWNAPNAPPRT